MKIIVLCLSRLFLKTVRQVVTLTVSSFNFGCYKLKINTKDNFTFTSFLVLFRLSKYFKLAKILLGLSCKKSIFTSSNNTLGNTV